MDGDGPKIREQRVWWDVMRCHRVSCHVSTYGGVDTDTQHQKQPREHPEGHSNTLQDMASGALGLGPCRGQETGTSWKGLGHMEGARDA